MPDFVPVAGSIECRITGVVTGGKKMYNIIHVDCGSPLPTYAECLSVATIVAAWVDGTYNQYWANDITSDEVRARSNAEEPGPVATVTGYAAAGALTADLLPVNTTMCVNLLGTLTGQSNRGKFYTFVADESVITEGLFSVGYATSLQTSLIALAADLAAGGFALAVESRRTLSLKQVVSYQAQRIPSHLRSRKANRGI
jgi:hypothetical protein